MKKLYTLFFLLTVVCSGVFAQKEAYNWTFGKYAGLTWNSKRTHTNVSKYPNFDVSSPSLPNMPTGFKSNILTYEGCFALSDSKTGELLFYSDGKTIYDKTGASITNGTGLSGHPSSSQSGVLMPYPGVANAKKYIVLSVPEVTGTVSYSVIDMTDGTPKVTSQKNITLNNGRGRIGESMNVIQHANKRDFWIVVPGAGKSQTVSNAWRVTKDGVDVNNPVISTNIPIVDNGNNTGSLNRYFKFSPNGKNFVWAYTGTKTEISGSFMIGNFNNETGTITKAENVTVYPGTGVSSSTYGVEFSASGKNLFLTGVGRLYVYNFNALLNNTSTPQTMYNLSHDDALTTGISGHAIYPGAPQLGPDGNIYMNCYDAYYTPQNDATESMGGTRRDMFVITNAEATNLASLNIYKLNNILTDDTGGQLGITSFSPSFFATDIEGPTEYCLGSPNPTYTFHIGGTPDLRPTKIRWYFDIVNSSQYTEQIIANDGSLTKEYTTDKYTTKGPKRIKVEVFNSSSTTIAVDELFMDVMVYDAAAVLTTSAPAVCTGNPATFSATASAGATLNWYTTETATTPYKENTLSFTTDDNLTADRTYYVEAVNPGCKSARVAVTATLAATPTVTATGQTICAGSAATLTATPSAGATVSWYTDPSGGTAIATGNTYTTLPLYTETTYYVEASVPGCGTSARQAVIVSISAAPTVDVDDITICTGKTASLTATVSKGATAKWYTSPTLGTAVATGNIFTTPVLKYTTTYYVEAEITGCTPSARKAVVVTVNPCVLPVNPNIHFFK